MFKADMVLDTYITLKENESLTLQLDVDKNYNKDHVLMISTGDITFVEKDDKLTFILSYIEKSVKVLYIDLIDPTILMQHYLNEMSGVNGLFSVQINWMRVITKQCLLQQKV